MLTQNNLECREYQGQKCRDINHDTNLPPLIPGTWKPVVTVLSLPQGEKGGLGKSSPVVCHGCFIRDE